ncbi:TPA: FAD-binding oxidoreductase [Pseudomonas putida]|jgi:glycine/D-amino acid oxidase-like deaminating enzyme|uniref:NAD(P)/FAD-dependent oxidoreductase n=1 Tax=Pseudomonas putida TaxID=303 RepID=UPI002363B6D9|nr:FAD-dependent oxidoreductase [Pseudomonas putida]MDD2008323.1 FAD-binding oxidoreductase [Pseudomonas putida]HDS1775788.1 FAD-binding oxidoreductase [Pseudomonas putida]
MQTKELIVVGGGLVGAAIAYGAARIGTPVTLLDQGDIAHRASRGNFGLVWVQSKGENLPRYALWSKDAVSYWPTLAQELLELTGVDVAYRQSGGFWIGFNDAEMHARERMLTKINNSGGGVPFEMLDNAELKARLPAIGKTVAGGSFCPLDGHANPLLLLHALHAGLKAIGGRIVSSVNISKIVYGKRAAGFEVMTRDGQSWSAPRVVIAAGLGSKALAAQVGLHAPVVPNRGQVLITERLKPFLPYPTNKARQTNEGTIQLGYSVEDVGLDDTTTVDAIEWIAKRSIATFPLLSDVRLVRAWGSLRVLTPDGLPIYQESLSCPGAFVATSHSGVSLAGAHAYVIGPWMAGMRQEPVGFDAFAGERFMDPMRKFSHGH